MFSRIEGDKAKNSDKINEQQLEEMDLTSITSDHRTVQNIHDVLKKSRTNRAPRERGEAKRKKQR